MGQAGSTAPTKGQARRPGRGLFAWLASLLGALEIEEEPRRPAKPRPPGAKTPAPVAVRGPEVPPVGAGVAAFARFAGVDIVAPEAPADAKPLSEGLKEEVLSHVFQHKPGPNSFPTLSTRILNLLSRPDDVDINDLVRLISQDTALSVSVLRAANSAGLRGLSEIQSVRDAITRMGLRDVSEVAGAMASRSLFSPQAKAEHAFQRERWVGLFLDASVVAMGAARLAMQTNRGRSDRAFLAGMLHDVGKTLVLKSLAMLHHQSGGEYALSDPEIDAMLDSLHVVVGAEVQREWSMAPYLVTVCERHHDASVPHEPEFDEVHLVRVTSCLRRIEVGMPCDAHLLAQMDDSLQALKLDAFQFRAFHTELKEIASRMQTLVV